MSASEVREVTGCAAMFSNGAGKRLLITEGETTLQIDLGSYTSMSFTANEARRIARGLYRTARRMEDRSHD